MAVAHLGKGIVIRNNHLSAISQKFHEVWPWNYGTRDVNSKDARSLAHREAFDLLESAFWPAETNTKFFALEGFPQRPPFHRIRFDVCLGKRKLVYFI